MTNNKRVAELRRRWREGALISTQETMKERNEKALVVLRNFSDIFTVIKAFQSLGELLKYVHTSIYSDQCTVVRRSGFP